MRLCVRLCVCVCVRARASRVPCLQAAATDNHRHGIELTDLRTALAPPPQVVHAQLQEEAGAMAAGHEAQLRAARDEAGRLQAERDSLAQQLEAAQDAVKVWRWKEAAALAAP